MGSQVLGVLVEEKGWFNGARVVRWSAVLSVGDDTLVIDSKTSVVKASEVPEVKDVFDQDNVLAGVRVRTTEGRDLGKFRVFYFDEKSRSSRAMKSLVAVVRSGVPTPFYPHQPHVPPCLRG